MLIVEKLRKYMFSIESEMLWIIFVTCQKGTIVINVIENIHNISNSTKINFLILNKVNIEAITEPLATLKF